MQLGEHKFGHANYEITVSIGPNGTVLCNRKKCTTSDVTSLNRFQRDRTLQLQFDVKEGEKWVFESQSVPTGPYFATPSNEDLRYVIVSIGPNGTVLCNQKLGLTTSRSRSQSVPTGPYIATIVGGQNVFVDILLVSIGPNGTVHCNFAEVQMLEAQALSQSVPTGPYIATYNCGSVH